MARVLTVNDVLDGHVTLDIECLDRIYLNAYVPILQTSSQVVAFLSGHLGFPFPSPVLFRQLGDRFRKAVLSFSDANDIPWIKFGKDEAKLEVMQPHLARQASTGRSGVAAIGVAQEFQRVRTAYEGKTSTGTPRWSFVKTDRRVTCYYFYLWDAGFGPAFIKVCAWFPYPAKIWLNGHEWVKRQAARAGIGFTALPAGSPPARTPPRCRRSATGSAPGTINVFTQRWLHRLPLPFGPEDHDAGYWWETSMRQVEISRTIVFDAPRHARGFFEALIAGNLDIGRPHNVEIIFARKIRRDTKGVFRTATGPPRQRRRPGQCLLQALADQAVPQGRPGDADRDRRRRPPRPGLQRPPAQPGRTPGQGPRREPAHTGCPNVPARAPSLRAQPLSGSRTLPQTRRGGGPRLFDSAILGSRPWPAPCARRCSPQPASPARTRAS